jgi:hypothetical protein
LESVKAAQRFTVHSAIMHSPNFPAHQLVARQARTAEQFNQSLRNLCTSSMIKAAAVNKRVYTTASIIENSSAALLDPPADMAVPVQLDRASGSRIAETADAFLARYTVEVGGQALTGRAYLEQHCKDGYDALAGPWSCLAFPFAKRQAGGSVNPGVVSKLVSSHCALFALRRHIMDANGDTLHSLLEQGTCGVGVPSGILQQLCSVVMLDLRGAGIITTKHPRAAISNILSLQPRLGLLPQTATVVLEFLQQQSDGDKRYVLTAEKMKVGRHHV